VKHRSAADRRRWIAAVIAAVASLTVAFAVVTVASASAATAAHTGSLAAKPVKPTKTTSASSTRTEPSGPAPVCSDGATAIWHSGGWYCPGYVIGVKTTAYGVDARIVLSGYVVQVVGTTVTVEGGPSCLPTSGTYCGQTVPDVIAYFNNLGTVPSYGQVITLYGITGWSTITATDYAVTGYYDPSLG
jgi:hypothetical protein